MDDLEEVAPQLLAGGGLAKCFDTAGSAVLFWSSLAQLLLVIGAVATRAAAGVRPGLAISGALALGGAFAWGHDPNLKVLAASSVVNTDLLLTVGVIVVTFALLAALAGQTKMLADQLPSARPWLLALCTLLLLWPLAGNLLLALMKQEVLELTGARLRIVALITNFPAAVTGVALAALGVVLALLLGKKFLPLRRAGVEEGAPIVRRKLLAQLRRLRRLGVTLLLALAVTAGGSAWWHLVASKPLKISQAIRVTLGAGGELRLPLNLATLADGRLHRFDWLADEGKVVRFFVINRFDRTVSPTVVYDACMLCGDLGYAQEDGQVVCIACGVRLYPPTIGNPGGCNPIPMEGWRIENDGITIPRASLEAGARYFTTVEKVRPAKPVTNSGQPAKEQKPCCGGS
jgi:uncharacterized membrane protein